MTLEEVETLDVFESYPWKNDRHEVSMMAYHKQTSEWKPLTGQAYIRVNPKLFTELAHDFKALCCK